MAFLNRHHALITAFCFASGLLLAYHFLAIFVGPLLFYLLIFCIAWLICSFLFFQRLFYYSALLAFFLAGLNMGLLHFASFKPDHLIFKPWQKAKGFQGWISATQYRKDGRNQYVLECQAIQIDSTWLPVQGKILLWHKDKHFRLQYGQCVRIQSHLQLPPLPANPGAFNYRRYLNFQDIFFTSYVHSGQIKIQPGMKGRLFKRLFLIPLKNRLRQIIDQNIPEPTNNLVQALILGERQNLDRQTYLQFQKTGIVHVLAISGLHVGFVLLLFVTLFSFLPVSYRQKYFFAFIFLGLFVALVNFKAPVVRASLMALLYFGLKELQRRPSNLNILGLAALLILLFDPDQLFQAGFQFSFAAVGGILFGYPHLKRWFHFPTRNSFTDLFTKWVWQPALVSFAAVLATLPLTWWYYGTIQTGAVFINLFIIPVMGLVVILSLILMLAGLLKLPLLKGLGLIIHYIFLATKTVIHLCAQWPFVQIKVGHPSIVMIFLAILATYFLYQSYKRLALMKGLLILFLLFLYSQFKMSNHLRVTFVDVGQGDACLVQLPSGINILVDGGQRHSWFDAGERYLKPLLDYFAIKRLRYVVATHAHNDHYGGLLTILKNFKVDTLVISPYVDKSKGYLTFLEQAKIKQIPIKVVRRGNQLNLGSDVRAYVLHPFGRFNKVSNHSGSEINNSSVVIKLCFGSTAFLLTGDVQKDVEQALQTFGPLLQSTVLKAGHHGSNTSSTLPFLLFVKPRFAVISVGVKNKFGHPSQIVLKRFKHSGIPALRTDRFGAIVFESDGKAVKVINWRKWLN